MPETTLRKLKLLINPLTLHRPQMQYGIPIKFYVPWARRPFKQGWLGKFNNDHNSHMISDFHLCVAEA